jgi:TolB-like protein
VTLGPSTERVTDFRPPRLRDLTNIGGAIQADAALLQSDKPSIAVLPFRNIGEAAHDYFADGIVDHLITALSRMSWLLVIARNSSFAYRTRSVDIEQIGRELGVRYLLEGSVRKKAHDVSITGRLIETVGRVQLWVGRFDGALEDLFSLQDEITESVVGQIAPELERAEIKRVQRKPIEQLHGYDHFLRGMAHFHQQTNEANSEALRFFRKAIELAPEFALPYGLAGICYSRRKARGWSTNYDQELVEAGWLAERAVELGHNDAVALYTGGYTIAHVLSDFTRGEKLIDSALALDPNSAGGWYYGGWVKLMLGKHDRAIEYQARAMRLSPLDPLRGLMLAATGFAHLGAGRYEQAVWWGQKACLEQPNFPVAWRLLAASNALYGRLDHARKAMARVVQLDPGFRASNLGQYITLARPEDLARYINAMRIAGMPQ